MNGWFEKYGNYTVKISLHYPMAEISVFDQKGAPIGTQLCTGRIVTSESKTLDQIEAIIDRNKTPE